MIARHKASIATPWQRWSWRLPWLGDLLFFAFSKLRIFFSEGQLVVSFQGKPRKKENWRTESFPLTRQRDACSYQALRKEFGWIPHSSCISFVLIHLLVACALCCFDIFPVLQVFGGPLHYSLVKEAWISNTINVNFKFLFPLHMIR